MSTQTLTTPSGSTIPGLTGRWAGLKLTRGFNPGPAWARRVLLLSPPGSGKTQFVSSGPRNLILDFEDSGRDIAHPKAMRFGPTMSAAGKLIVPTVREYEALMTQLVSLASDPDRPVDTIVWDTVDAYIQMICDEFCKENQIAAVGDYRQGGAGWYVIRARMMQNFNKLVDAGYGLVLVGHLTTREIKESTVTVPSMSQSFRDALYREVQYIFYAKKLVEAEKVEKTIEVPQPNGPAKIIKQMVPTGKTKTAYTISVITPNGPEDADNSKSRIPIDERIVLGPDDGWDAYVSAYDRAVSKIQESK